MPRSHETLPMAMILGYWDMRRLADAIRLLLEYTASTYAEKYRYVGDAPGYDRSQWLSDKFTLGLDFPNLPYLIDGLTGSPRATSSFATLLARITYVGRRRRRRVTKTFWRQRLWTRPINWPGFATALTLRN